MTFIRVAVEAPLLTPLTYKWPHETAPLRGVSIEVPLGKRKSSGVILGEDPSPGDHQFKAAFEIRADRPHLPEKYLAWLEWLADYYVHPIGQVTSLAFPPLKKAEKKRASKKAPVVRAREQVTPPVLTDEQKVCIDAIRGRTGFKTHLIHGVTGSGKTEIYLRLLQSVLESGKQGLMLVPEIALTPQLIDRFAGRFGDAVAVIHSQLTEREKTEQWWSVFSGEKKILIGARSALFCPLANLGMIIVDEEHEASYKQDEKLKYHARDAAVMLGKMLDCPVILGSATPSLESWNNVLGERYELHQLKNRVSRRPLPKIDVVDLRDEKHQKKEAGSDLPFWLSRALHSHITQTLARGEQSALFLNRRGVAQTVLCQGCGFVHSCPNCSITLTLHGKRNLVCHYCDYAHLKEEMCPHCKLSELSSVGLGTEQIEEDLKNLFPGARIARADRDEISRREDMETLIKNMEDHEIDILVGTQMIAKGLDFPKLTLVGLVLADVGFNLPDFRSVERNYQLLTQVSGRSGRHVEDGGLVVIQTYNPEYEGLQYALAGDFQKYAENELQVRREMHYPPFGRLASFRISGTDAGRASQAADRLAGRAEDLKAKFKPYNDIQVLGPAEAPLSKLRGRYRHHLLLKAPHNVLSAFSRQLIGDGKWIPAGTKVQVDIDPINLM